jgi:photosystem II stability/assembly factor-like uncharacterized protein
MTSALKPLALILVCSAMAAGCSWFGRVTYNAGVVKTVNGGADWQLVNAVADTKVVPSLDGVDVSTLQFSPGLVDTIYLASFNAGLWVTGDSGAVWRQILSRLSVYDVAFDPFDDQTMYAAGSFNGTGKLLSTRDNGGSWVEIYTTAIGQDIVRAVAVSPVNPQEIYIGMNSGNLYKSVDGGVTWGFVHKLSGRLQSIRFSDGGLYVLSRQTGILFSRDGGKTFANLTQKLQAGVTFFSAVESFNAPTVSEFFGYAQSVLNSNVFYVSTAQGLWRTVNRGTDWTRVRLPVKEEEATTRGVAISPKNDSVVYTAIGSVVYKTLDGGTNWQTHNLDSKGFPNVFLIDPERPQIVYTGLYAGN